MDNSSRIKEKDMGKLDILMVLNIMDSSKVINLRVKESRQRMGKYYTKSNIKVTNS